PGRLAVGDRRGCRTLPAMGAGVHTLALSRLPAAHQPAAAIWRELQLRSPLGYTYQRHPLSIDLIGHKGVGGASPLRTSPLGRRAHGDRDPQPHQPDRIAAKHVTQIMSPNNQLTEADQEHQPGRDYTG